MGASKTECYFKERAARANPEDLKWILATSGSLTPREGDEIPEGWFQGVITENDGASRRGSLTRMGQQMRQLKNRTKEEDIKNE